MSWILLVTALIAAVLVIIVLRGKLKKVKPLIELQAEEGAINTMAVEVGQFVYLEADTNRKEVAVYPANSGKGIKLGVLNNSFIYRNVIKNNIKAKIDSINGGKIMLEIVRLH